MNYMDKSKLYINELYEYASLMDIPKEGFINAKNLNEYVATAVDAYKGYSVFQYMYDGKYDEVELAQMLTIDYKSWIDRIAGMSVSQNYESIVLLEPPNAKRVGMLDYIRTATLPEFKLLFRPSLHRLEKFSKFALKLRKQFLDERTWYFYIFATRHDAQGKKYGKRLMNVLLSFAEDRNYRICLETNSDSNLSMYEHFGFKKMVSSCFNDSIVHYVMLFG